MKKSTTAKKTVTTPPIKEFSVNGGLSARLNPEETEKVLDAHKLLSGKGPAIQNQKEYLMALVEYCLFASNTPDGKEIEELRKKVLDLETQLSEYSSINITQLQVDNLDLRTQNETQSQELTRIREENETLQKSVDRNEEESENIVTLHKGDVRLQKFFTGANARIAASKPNIHGRKTKDYTDVIQDLADFARVNAHQSELFKG